MSNRCPILTTFLTLCWFVSACSSAIQPSPVSDDHLLMLRSEVRRIIRPGCGSCHTAGLPTAKPAALAVFDLAQDDWSAPMTAEELHGLYSRTRDIRDTLATKVEALVAAELALRESAADPETEGRD